MNVGDIVSKQTTLTNTGLVASYAGISGAIVTIVDERWETVEFSQTEQWLYPVVLAGLLAFAWNFAKDRGWITDNRG